MAENVIPVVQIQRAKGTPASEGRAIPQRGTTYAEGVVLSVHQKQHTLADEGSYFVARNPTPGTGVAGHAAPTTLDDTKPFLELF
ncbi:MAG TPA: hypothetical protein VEB22_00585, partial [Phycisphaerales bacterium]|nr:hypothetical protein [Phycisphaerales bacterium]